jgi:hypothetical protein
MSAPATRRAALAETLLLAAVALAATYPIFIDTYRSMIFQTTPRDDYAPYLLRLVGDGGEIPGSPRVYRVLSVAVAIPAYYVLPPYRFKNLEAVDPHYLRATEALAFVSWIALAALSVLVYRGARDRLGASRGASAAAMFATLAFARYTSIVGVDPLALLLVAAMFYWFAHPAMFAAIVVLSAGFNEKVWIIAALLVGARIVHSRSLRPYRVHALACVVAIAAYAGSVMYFRAAMGNERPSLGRPILVDAPATLRMTLSGKGLSQNVFPIAIVLGACAWSARRLRGYRGPYWSPWDVLVPVGLAMIGIAMNVEYTLGRLVFHSIPLVMPPLAAALDRAAVEARADPAVPAAAITGHA